MLVDRLRAAVVGTGLIGGSILLRLRERGIDVAGWDPDAATRAEGRSRGVSYPDALADAVRDRDVVFLCGPLSSLPGTLLTVSRWAGPDCVVTDVGSTKGGIAGYAAAHGLTDRFVPGHPMAGTERAGLTAAAPALFDGAAWVLCPTAAGIDRFRTLAALLIDVFGARVVPLEPDAHDAAAALASHLPHLLAGALAATVADTDLRDAVLGLAAGSFRDGTRVVGTPAARTVDMLLNNRAQVLAQLDRVAGLLDRYAAALRDGDAAALAALQQRARGLRLALLDRELPAATPRAFPLGMAGEDELAYLLALGAAGGYLTGCEVTPGTVTYAAHLPAAPA
ncbi:prephenate dehydrogenase/arogenate dehydrogenase family protein [Micromonospora sp. KC207]|uniref:prephenate dehydrogenase n=1 Tax=Micromonospora sp. KC207 TaxID=2530377 RepID=UPI0010531A6F|nr:prephenate dehydrogenase/arogenate dehydrogenase family protein [Micromonospora sp. KC207]TDC61343.1 prephenate dehydrogenase/arogenate dehydrogenase family protein [Micromonospora sp. KC207]